MSDEIKKNSPSEDVLKELEEQEVVVNQPADETPVEVTEPATEESEKEEVVQPEAVEEQVKETHTIEEGKK